MFPPEIGDKNFIIEKQKNLFTRLSEGWEEQQRKRDEKYKFLEEKIEENKRIISSLKTEIG